MSEALVRHYFELATSPDRDAFLAQFAPDAEVQDEGRVRRGVQEIRGWRAEVPPVGYAVRSIAPQAAAVVARAEISGDFPGSPVTLTFRFEFEDGLIRRLAITT